jgi:hypothetical protein
MLARLLVPMPGMLCAQWNSKEYPLAKKEGILELIATHQKMHKFYIEKEKQRKLSKYKVLGSKMRLINVVFLDDFLILSYL